MKSLKKLLALPNLQSLDIEATKFNDRMAAVLHESPTLRSLDIGATRITGKGLEHIARLQHLRSLDLWATRLEEADFDLLARLPQLEYLSVGHYYGIRTPFNPDTLLKRLSAIASLKRLWLDGVLLTDAQKEKYKSRFADFRHTI
jgi:Leucine Rich repeat